MERLVKLFGRSIRFTYHCFDRIVIRGYLSTLSRPNNLMYFFRTIKQEACIGKENTSATNRSIFNLGQCLHKQQRNSNKLG